MKKENTQKQNEQASQKAGIRVSQPTKKLERSLIVEANSMTNFGRKVTSEDLWI